MTEFTLEWVVKAREQMKHISPLPWEACSCGKCGQISNEKDCIAIATRGNWGDDYPIIKPVGGSIGGQYEVVMEQITYGHVPPETGNNNAQYIAEACNNYPEALDHIERLQKRVKELEHFLEEAAHAAACGKNPADYLATKAPTTLRDHIEQLQTRLQELEQERRWVPVSESPEETGYYIISWENYVHDGKLKSDYGFSKLGKVGIHQALNIGNRFLNPRRRENDETTYLI